MEHTEVETHVSHLDLFNILTEHGQLLLHLNTTDRTGQDWRAYCFITVETLTLFLQAQSSVRSSLGALPGLPAEEQTGESNEEAG